MRRSTSFNSAAGNRMQPPGRNQQHLTFDPICGTLPCGHKGAIMLEADNRPWGRWEEYLNEPGYRVKRLIIHVGKRFSLQRHKKRSEHWVIVRGTGKVTINDETRVITAGDRVFIGVGDLHRLENTGEEFLVVIETQMGICLEEDIIRIEDDWGRS
ncbi:cupin domain-containing protein [Mariprofundus erugo]|uniref:Cupin domain-containing protein n=2 Tax=Mariprofundus erugo TaxID=2528639 RepID=A0A5R9GPQ6_9PROT|nr:cupin domain-containing protein [Mariprofundus erugo]